MARNYGDPAGEYEAARTAAVVIDRADRRFLRVHGRDPVRMVQGLVTNDIVKAPADRAVYAAVLTPKGRMVADVRVVRLGDAAGATAGATVGAAPGAAPGAELLLETDHAAADALAAHLRKFVPPLFARFEAADDAWSALSVLGPASPGILRTVLGDVVPDADREDALVVAPLGRGDGSAIVVATGYGGVPGYDVLLPHAAVQDVWQRLQRAGARPAGHATLDVLRIEAGRPRWGAELRDTTIPLEAGLRERAISESKGCYTGQEVIVRILHRGHVNWVLRALLLGDAATPPPDTPLLNDAGKAVGRVTSAAWSPRFGQAVGLGYVRREVEPPSSLRLGDLDGPRVEVRALPLPAPAGA